MHLHFDGVNGAFRGLVQGISSGEIATLSSDSRNGPVLRVIDPVTVTYEWPCERVLINDTRDCNPFFHLYESLWMLAGRNEVDSVAYYASNMRNYSDDGLILWGAYGHRWSYWFGHRQLESILDELAKNPDSRRAVLQMWDGKLDLGKACCGGKDVPCNLSATFQIVNDCLDMTVFNRSNDLIWGMLGANAVHFSVLLEYMAHKLGVTVGKYHQISTNLHVYTWNWKPEEWLNDSYAHIVKDDYPDRCKLGDLDDAEVLEFVKRHGRECLEEKKYASKFLETVAQPMCLAFHHHKRREYDAALAKLETVASEDWKLAGTLWIAKRERNYLDKEKT